MADMTEATFAQHGMRMTQAASGGTAYHTPLMIHLGSRADAEAVSKACVGLVERHPLLAAAVVERDGVSYVAPAENAPALRVAEPGEVVADEIGRPFDLEHGPLIRFVLFDADLVVTAHHIVFDGFSKDILVRDFLTLCDGAEVGPPPAAFAEHADALRGRVEAVLDAAREFWTSRWSGPPLVVVRNGVLNSRRAEPGSVLDFELPRVEIAGLTVFETAVAALHALLFSYGNSRPLTAIDLSTRTAETADVIGPFVNELPLASEPAENMTFRDFGLRVRSELREIYRFREVPLARAVPRVGPHAALAPISLSFRERSRSVGADVEWLVFNGAVRGDLQLQVVDTGGVLEGSLRYSSRAAELVRSFAEDLSTLLRRVAQDPDRLLADLLTVQTAAPVSAVPVVEPASAVANVDNASDDLVEQIREIWQEVLGIDRVEVDDDLFDLGGHSLTVTRIIARMRERLGIELEIDDFFDYPTIAGALHVANTR